MMDKILIVDDNPKNIQFLGNILSEYEYEIEYAQDGLEALSIIETEDFDLILMDVMMPRMDGFEACRRIKMMDEKADIPITFLTAKTDTESITHAFDSGGIDYLSKPINQKELLARVKTHISLKKNQERIKNLNAELEAKVNERTKELRAANSKLINANKELALLDQTKSKFLQLISNEIKKPLNGIIGPLQLLKNVINNENIIQLLQLLDESVKRLEKFSNDTTLITNIKSKDFDLDIQPLQAPKLIEMQLIDISEDISEKGLEINLQGMSNELEILADQHLFTECTNRVFRNAIEFSHPNSSIELRSKQTDDWNILSITNVGDGFNESVLKCDLDIFESIQNPDDESIGVGFDLYLVNLIMHALSGKLEYGNNVDSGIYINLFFKR